MCDALSVDDLKTNLLSVAKIADTNNTLTFDKNKAVKRGEDGKIKVVAKRIRNLYYYMFVVGGGCEEIDCLSARSDNVNLEIC